MEVDDEAGLPSAEGRDGGGGAAGGDDDVPDIDGLNLDDEVVLPAPSPSTALPLCLLPSLPPSRCFFLSANLPDSPFLLSSAR